MNTDTNTHIYVNKPWYTGHTKQVNTRHVNKECVIHQVHINRSRKLPKENYWERLCISTFKGTPFIIEKKEGERSEYSMSRLHLQSKKSQRRQTGGARRIHRRTQNWGKQEWERVRRTGRPVESWDGQRRRLKERNAGKQKQGDQKLRSGTFSNGQRNRGRRHKESERKPHRMSSLLSMALSNIPCSSTTTHTHRFKKKRVPILKC